MTVFINRSVYTREDETCRFRLICAEDGWRIGIEHLDEPGDDWAGCSGAWLNWIDPADLVRIRDAIDVSLQVAPILRAQAVSAEPGPR